MLLAWGPSFYINITPEAVAVQVAPLIYIIKRDMEEGRGKEFEEIIERNWEEELESLFIPNNNYDYCDKDNSDEDNSLYSDGLK